MRYEHISQVFLLAKLLKQVDYLRLDRNVKRRYTLIAYDEFRLHRKRAGNGNTLTLSSGELMRIPEEHILLKSALLHGVDNVITHFLGALTVEFVSDQSLFDDLSDREAGVQAGIRILEDDLKILTQNAHFPVLQARKVDSVVAHRLVHIESGVSGI